MKALCPYCVGKSCDKCHQGYLEVQIAEGAIYTRHCNSCGQDNGGRIVGPEFPLDVSESPGICVFCRSSDTKWELVGISGN
jgi:hypothetical protein